jgi:hypothetical protein
MLIFLKIPICQMVVNNSLGHFAFFSILLQPNINL